MEGWLFLNVVVRESAPIFQLLAGKDKPLLIRRDTFFVLDLCLDILNAVRRLNLQGDSLASQGFDKNLHSSTKTQDQMEGWLFLNVVVWESASIFQLLASKDKPLLIGWDSFFVLNLRFNILNAVRRLNFQSDGFASQGLHKDLHTTTQTQNQVEGRFFLDVVVRESATIFKLLAGKDEPLLIGRDTFFVLDLCFDILNAVWWLHFQGDSLASQGLYKDLHTTSETQDQMKGRLFLDVVVRESATIF